jgi:hypothetical protein
MTMTRAIALLISLVPTLATAAGIGAPTKFGYQGRLLSAGGAPLVGRHQVTFRLYKDPTDTAVLWSETQTLVTTNGFYATFLGAVTALPADYGSTVIDGSDLYLGVTVDSQSPVDELKPRQQIGAVFYALRAAWAARASEADHAAQADAAATATNVAGTGNFVKTAWLDATDASVSGSVNATAFTVGTSRRKLATMEGSGLIAVTADAVRAGSVESSTAAISGTLTADRITVANPMSGSVVGGMTVSRTCVAPGGLTCSAYTYGCSDAWGKATCPAAGADGQCTLGAKRGNYGSTSFLCVIP